MDALTLLRKKIARADSKLLGPQPLAHSQELADHLPLVRRHLGPRPWYQCLEAAAQSDRTPV